MSNIESDLTDKFNNCKKINLIKLIEEIDENEDETSKRSIELKVFEHIGQAENAKAFLDDDNALRYLEFLSDNSDDWEDSIVFDQLTSEEKLKFIKLLLNLIDYLFQNYDSTLRKYFSDYREKKNFYNEIELLTNIGDLIVNYTNMSTSFASSLIQNNGLAILLESFVILIDQFLTLENKTNFDLYEICNSLSSTIFNTSKLKNSFVQEWKETDALNILLNQSLKIKGEHFFADINITIYASIAFIFEEKDLDRLTEIQEAVKSLSEIVEFCANLVKRSDPPRDHFKMHGDGDRVVESVISNNDWLVIEIFQCLYRLSVSDSIKHDIYFRYMCNKYLRDFIYFGNEFEKEFALKLLWQLCFENKIGEDICQDEKLYSIIKEISDNKGPKELVRCCSGIIWLINEKTQPKKSSQSISSKLKHVMISYNSKTRDQCLKIKSALENEGYKIWIDVENIHGSSLESMANAIEESSCVLMCMTEKYKQSANCRLEAEYCINQNKPIVPLIMEKAYKPDGWLGIILGSKIFIDFTKYEFNECLHRLKREIEQLTRPKYEPKNTENTRTLKGKDKFLIKASAWTENDVLKWFHDKKIANEIIDSLIPCDGELLYLLYDMYLKCPEYYSSLNTDKKIRLRELLYFTNELKKLFQQ